MVFSRAFSSSKARKNLSLLFARAFLLAELGVTLLIGAPFFDAELFQLGIRNGFALLMQGTLLTRTYSAGSAQSSVSEALDALHSLQVEKIPSTAVSYTAVRWEKEAREEKYMDRSFQGSHSSLFTVRVWQEEIGAGQTEWRGKVQLVSSGEVRYFRDWAALAPLLLAMLSDWETQPEASRDAWPGDGI